MTRDQALAPIRSTATPSFILTLPEQEALSFLVPLSADYPNFESWFRTTVVPGLRVGTRKLIRIERNDLLVGVGIAKREDEEQKICTVRIAQAFVGRGFGIRIFDSLLRWVGTDKPHLTVSEKKLPVFDRIFEYYGFALTSAQVGRYVSNVTELSYNETKQS